MIIKIITEKKQKISKNFASSKNSRTFAALHQGRHLFKVAKYHLFNNISVKVSYSRNAIQSKA